MKKLIIWVLLSAFTGLFPVAINRAEAIEGQVPLLVILLEYSGEPHYSDNGTPGDPGDDYRVSGSHDEVIPGEEGDFTRDNGSIERNIIYGQIFGGDPIQYPVYPRVVDGVISTPAYVNGERRCMNGYFKEISGGKFQFDESKSFVSEWITAWDDPDTPVDESTFEYWKSLPGYGEGKAYWWALLSLNKAFGDNFDFAKWDANNDGYLMIGNMENAACELAVLIVQNFFKGGGAARGLYDNVANGITVPGWYPGVLQLNNIIFNGSSMMCGVAAGNAEDIGGYGVFNPFYIFAHELGHAVFGFDDTYGNDPEKVLFGLYGGNRGPYHLDPYQKDRIGWLTPTVVTQDGWYDIPDVETTNQAFILRDPSHGSDEFFIVENRYAGNSYDNVRLNFEPPRMDNNILYDYLPPDQGLFIWHIDETPPSGKSKIQLIHRDGSSGSGSETERFYYRDAAFSGEDPKNPEDPPYYNFYDNSSPANARWRNGSESRCGVWAISNSAKTMRAYLDVPGPGVFIQHMGYPQETMQAGSGGKRFVFEIGNTDEVDAVFIVEIIGLSSELVLYPDPTETLKVVSIPAKTRGGAYFDISFNSTIGGFNDTFTVKVSRQDMPAINDDVDVHVTICNSQLDAPWPTVPIGGMTVDGQDITLSWTNVTDVLDHFDIQICEDSACSQVVRSGWMTNNSWHLNGVLPGANLFYWRVRANDDCSTSDWSVVESFQTVCDVATPVAPTLLDPADGDTGLAVQFPLEWTVVADATAYEVVVTRINSISNVVHTFHVTPDMGKSICEAMSRMCYDMPATLEAGDYEWKVRAKNGCASSDFSSPNIFSTLDKPLLSYPYNGASAISEMPTFEWQPVDGAVSYEIMVNTSPWFSSFIANATVSSTQWPCTVGLSENTTYYWTVRALNDEFIWYQGPWGTTRQFTTCSSPQVNELPNPSPVEGATEVSIPTKLSWDSISGDSISFDVKVYDYAVDLGNGEWGCDESDLVRSATNVGLQWTVTPTLDTGQEYWWAVTLNHTCGTIVFPPHKFTTTECPVPTYKPAPLSPSYGEEVSTAPALDWGYNFGGQFVGNREVQVCADAQCASVIISASDLFGNTWTVAPELEVANQYWWRVRNTYACGEGPWSNISHFLTPGAGDDDEDGIMNAADNCPHSVNPDQEDLDGDGAGDACDPDVDGDGVSNTTDNCMVVNNPGQEDTDGDGAGDLCDDCPSDIDVDMDGVCDDFDNCSQMPNGPDAGTCISGNEGAPCSQAIYTSCVIKCSQTRIQCELLCPIGDLVCLEQCDTEQVLCARDCDDGCGSGGLCSQGQEDSDRDGTGDVCEYCILGDTDEDGICDEEDNCPQVPNGPDAGTCLEGDVGASCGDDVYSVCTQGCSDTLDACLTTCGPGGIFCQDICQSDYTQCIQEDCGYGCGIRAKCSLSQEDSDSDGTGDACDSCRDDDGDGICNADDNCPGTPNGPGLGTCINGNDGDSCDNNIYGGCMDGCQNYLDTCLDTCGALDFNCKNGCQTDFETCEDGCPGGCGKFGQCSQGQEDTDADSVGDVCDECSDTDHDGVCDSDDNCPQDANSDQRDQDGDGVGDWCDSCTDPDQDGLCNSVDDCPLDPENDQDGDSVCGDVDNCPGVINKNQADDDNDGVGNSCDNCLSIRNTDQADSDGDGIGDACDSCFDKDNDTICDEVDNCVLVANTGQADADNDGVGDVCDNCPSVRNAGQADRNGDGIGDVCSDADGDGILDDADNCPDIANPSQIDHDSDTVGDVCDNCPSDENRDQVDSDGDGTGDTCDSCTDSDSDGVCDITDNCPDARNPDQADWDQDGIGDVCDVCRDQDRDDICDYEDNCIVVFNPDQADQDRDKIGDRCDLCPEDADNDADHDGVCGNIDNCPDTSNMDQKDKDGDGLGDFCDPCPLGDRDRDGICDIEDNCRAVPNPDQLDTDGDGVGNTCDPCLRDPDNDKDNDGICGDMDNCPDVNNPGQEDTDADDIGNACDICRNDPQNDEDSDGVCGNIDNCPTVANPDQTDSDGDGRGDACPIADLDGDGDVDGSDIALFSVFYKNSNNRADLNWDGAIDERDIFKFAQAFGSFFIEN